MTGHRTRRRIGTALIVVGVVALGYGAAVYFWHDPVTDLYTRWKQHQLAGQLDREFARYRASIGLPTDPAAGNDAPVPAADAAAVAALERSARQAAQRFLASVELGQPLGRLVVPRLGIDPVFVNGTRWAQDLTRGPGRYPQTSLPGLGKVTAIAGHRTTFGAPFRHIDRLRPGDPITLELPYGTFRYRVFGHEIVKSDDWSIIRPRGFDTLVLSACHPLYSASHRWIVYARLVFVTLPDGRSYRLPAGVQAVAATASG